MNLLLLTTTVALHNLRVLSLCSNAIRWRWIERIFGARSIEEVCMRNTTPPKTTDAPELTQRASPTDLKRRRFLLTLSASGAGVAVAAANVLPSSAATPETANDAADNASSYRETAHVRDYYRTTKI